MLYIFLTVLLTVYGQLIIKWQIISAGIMPADLTDKVIFLLKLLSNIYILSGFAAAFFAALSWMIAMSRFELSYAYPFMSLSFVIVLICSAIFFSEPINWQKLLGLVFIITGLCITVSK